MIRIDPRLVIEADGDVVAGFRDVVADDPAPIEHQPFEAGVPADAGLHHGRIAG